jgi:hypothetical protein
VAGTLDNERFLSSLRMAGQSAVGETEPIGLVGHVHHAAGRQCVEQTDPSDNDHVGVGSQRSARGVDLDARAQMGLPTPKAVCRPLEGPIRQVDAVAIVDVPVRKGLAPCAA